MLEVVAIVPLCEMIGAEGAMVGRDAIYLSIYLSMLSAVVPLVALYITALTRL